ncbi:MAG: hypothetical protein QOE70_821 [Chthoniobacter sp.]|jgi:D-alanyl-D-alanine carboxypeptidase (penicillin-binding protein 5/6)|nr:hypothetical protein [Chthoniobacter sp.]
MASPLPNTLCLLAVLLALLPAEAGAAIRKKRKPPEPAKAQTNRPDPTPEPRTRPDATPQPRNYHKLAEGELPLAAKGAIVLDAYTGQPLYEKSADLINFPASTTKIMTALLVIEAGNLDQEVEVTVEDSKVGESSLNLLPGQHYTRRQMLFGLMLKSANDVAHALGRDNAGSAEAFAERMTMRAWELGATNTSFRNPNGLHDPQHFTTARDLALIARAAMQQPYFRMVVSTKTYPWVAPPNAAWELRNHNRLLFQFPGCTGVKTGYTYPSQQVLVSAAMRGQREVIAVVMHTDKPGIWEDSKLLLTYGFENPPAPGRPVPQFQ